MKRVFVDTHFILALLNPRDSAHQQALSVAASSPGNPTTTQWVLAEVADALRDPIDRRAFLDYLRNIESDPSQTIVPASDELFHRGVDFYESRLDKQWSLTDCISFVVMSDLGIGEALTADRHFQQAGFVTLL